MAWYLYKPTPKPLYQKPDRVPAGDDFWAPVAFAGAVVFWISAVAAAAAFVIWLLFRLLA